MLRIGTAAKNTYLFTRGTLGVLFGFAFFLARLTLSVFFGLPLFLSLGLFFFVAAFPPPFFFRFDFLFLSNVKYVTNM